MLDQVTMVDAPAADQRRRARVILLAAAMFGVLTEGLVHANVWDGTDPGLGLAMAGVLGAGLIIGGRFVIGRSPSTLAVSLAAGTGLFSALVAVRASSVLVALDVAAALGCYVAALTTYHEGRLRIGIAPLAFAGIGTMVEAVARPLSVIAAAGQRPSHATIGRVAAIGGGLLIAAPILLVFAALFASADEVFALFLHRLVSFDVPPSLVSGTMLAVLLAYLAAGALAVAGRPMTTPAPLERRPALHSTVAATVLTSVIALFAAFVTTQVGEVIAAYGGSAVPYAELARRGFFQLVTVGALVVPLVLAVDYLAKPTGASTRIDALHAILIALTAAVLVSAVTRMVLYVRAFGLTELRVYTTAFMIWIAIVLGWTARTVLRGMRDRFVWPVLGGALGVLLVLNLINPEALIAEYNISHIGSEASVVDGAYLAGNLSADAMPAVLANLHRIEDECERAILGSWLLTAVDDYDGWRSWNLGRHLARAAIAAEPTIPLEGC